MKNIDGRQETVDGQRSEVASRAGFAFAMFLLSCAIFFLIFVLGSSARAQEPASSASSVSQQAEPKKLKLDALDKAWIATIVGDRVSTEIAFHRCPGCREVSPIKHGWAMMSMQVGCLAATKWVERKYPNRSTLFRAFKGAIVAVGTGAIINNLTRSKKGKENYGR